MAKSFAELVEKFNPYHDSKGRFATARGAASFTYSPGKSKAHDMAIAREKARTAEADAKEARRRELRGRLKEKRLWDSMGPLVDDPKSAVALGRELEKEIEHRFKERKKAGLTNEYDTEPTQEDIYGVLKDLRDFGCPEELRGKFAIDSDLNDKDTNEIVNAALDRYPADWYKSAAEYGGECTVFVHDVDGRASHNTNPYSHNDDVIRVYARESPNLVRDLNLDTDRITNEGIANSLTHELGHYFELHAPDVGGAARQYYEARTKNCETTSMYNGELTKADKFADEYMGKVYGHGATEITSVLTQKLGYALPVTAIKSGFFSTRKDHQSYQYILGMLGGGGWNWE